MRKMSFWILAIVIIYVATSVGWLALAALIEHRTIAARTELRGEVVALWGGEHHAQAPEVYYEFDQDSAEEGERPEGQVSPAVTAPMSLPEREALEARQPARAVYVPLERSDITVKLDLDHRKKGLLWYSTYNVSFVGHYAVKNTTDRAREFTIRFTFPTTQAIYDNFTFRVGEEQVDLQATEEGRLLATVWLEPGQEVPFAISYDSRGLDRWSYDLGRGVRRVKNFRLRMITDFKAIDFPAGTVSPTAKLETEDGWELLWEYDDLVSGFRIAMEMPKPVNPGPMARQITLFAPISLLFFFFIIFILSVLRGVRIHPMNYLFLAAGFFSFHLLFAYLVDHMNIHLAMAISSLTSVGLVVSYLRLVVGPRFAIREAGLAQVIYLVLFSYAHFLRGYTGLTLTVGAILTLAVLMQLTGRIDWEERLSRYPSRQREQFVGPESPE